MTADRHRPDPPATRSPRLRELALPCFPLTPDRWSDLETLFGVRGACGGCWCMVWRLPARLWSSHKGVRNRSAFRKLVQAGPPPGVLAYSDKQPVGWCAIAPREHYDFLTRSRLLRPVDSVPVWSVSCLFVRRADRRQGVATMLLRGAVAYAHSQGAAAVEGYPVVPAGNSMPDAFAWTGTPSAFLAAGFVEIASPSPRRRIMRHIRS